MAVERADEVADRQEWAVSLSRSITSGAPGTVRRVIIREQAVGILIVAGARQVAVSTLPDLKPARRTERFSSSKPT